VAELRAAIKSSGTVADLTNTHGMSLVPMPLNRYALSTPVRRVRDYRAELLAAVDDLPPLPLVLDRLMKLLRDASSSASQIAALIEKDVVLSGSVLRCVNSAYYGLQSNVSSIRHAVTLLGFSTVRNLAMAFSMRTMVTGAGVPPRSLYSRYSQHSLSCALVSQFLAEHAPVANAEAAFAAGLFHDVGKLLMMTTFPELQTEVQERFESGGTYEGAETEMLGITHSEVSRIVLERWQLPAHIQAAAACHHRPEEAAAAGAEELPLAQVVHAADLFVNEYGLQIQPTKRVDAFPADRAFEDIGLRQKKPEILEKFQKEYEGIRSLL